MPPPPARYLITRELRRYDTYDDVMAVLPKLPRPVLISFQRGDAGWSAGTGAGVTDAFRAKSMSSQQPDQAVQQAGQDNNYRFPCLFLFLV